MSAASPMHSGGRQCLGPAAPCLGPMPCQPFHRHRHRQRSDTPPLLGGGLCLSGFLGPIYPDESRQSPTFTRKALSAAIFSPTKPICRRHFCGFHASPCNRWHFPILPILHDRMSQEGPFMGRRRRRNDSQMRYPATTCDALPHDFPPFPNR